MKHIFKITTAVLAILLAFTLYKLSEKEFQLQSVLVHLNCKTDPEFETAWEELCSTQIAVDENGNTYLAVDEAYFEKHNIPVKYFKVIKRSAKQIGKDYKKQRKEFAKKYGEDKMQPISEVIEQQRQAYLESKKYQ